MKTTLAIIFCVFNLAIMTMLFLEIQDMKQYLNDKTLVLNKEIYRALSVYKINILD
jgi:hypothetical protein